MHKQNGATLGELISAIGFCALVVLIALLIWIGRNDGQPAAGLHCFNGYTYLVQQDGKAQQMLDESGGGIICKLQ